MDIEADFAGTDCCKYAFWHLRNYSHSQRGAQPVVAVARCPWPASDGTEWMVIAMTSQPCVVMILRPLKTFRSSTSIMDTQIFWSPDLLPSPVRDTYNPPSLPTPPHLHHTFVFSLATPRLTLYSNNSWKLSVWKKQKNKKLEKREKMQTSAVREKSTPHPHL